MTEPQRPAEPETPAPPPVTETLTDATGPQATGWRARLTKRVMLIGSGALLIVIVGVVLLVTLTGGRDLRVNFSLLDFDGGSSCSGGSGGYSDVGSGMSVVVRDNDNHVIGTGALADGTSITVPNQDIGGVAGCIWSATISDLPSEDYYSVSVGNRGSEVYSHDQLDQKDWTVDLQLGGN